MTIFNFIRSLKISQFSLSLSEVFDGLRTLELRILFNNFLATVIFPMAWKNSLVRLILNSGDRTNVRNYRPIALNNFVPELFKKLIAAKLRLHVDSILYEEQHGFRSGRVTTTNLALLNSYLYHNLEDKHQRSTQRST